MIDAYCSSSKPGQDAYANINLSVTATRLSFIRAITCTLLIESAANVGRAYPIGIPNVIRLGLTRF